VTADTRTEVFHEAGYEVHVEVDITRGRPTVVALAVRQLPDAPPVIGAAVCALPFASLVRRRPGRGGPARPGHPRQLRLLGPRGRSLELVARIYRQAMSRGEHPTTDQEDDR
jgi:hypothetical protein